MIPDHGQRADDPPQWPRRLRTDYNLSSFPRHTASGVELFGFRHLHSKNLWPPDSKGPSEVGIEIEFRLEGPGNDDDADAMHGERSRLVPVANAAWKPHAFNELRNCFRLLLCVSRGWQRKIPDGRPTHKSSSLCSHRFPAPFRRRTRTFARIKGVREQNASRLL